MHDIISVLKLYASLRKM
uniref:Uncharacterized protein n=1 Tax=Arundo donax TaxID=35708 RepID=A0A0A9ERB5_ARUDO